MSLEDTLQFRDSHSSKQFFQLSRPHFPPKPHSNRSQKPPFPLSKGICRNSIIMSSFASLNLRPELLFSLQALHYASPSAAQVQFLPPLLKGRDLMGQARAGTGKTLAFVIAALNGLNLDELSPQVLVLTPTHELAIQTSEEITKIGKTMRVICKACYGGTEVRRDVQALQHGVQVVVGTLGRVYDLILNGRLETDQLKMLVIDDADMLASRKYSFHFNYILRNMPKRIQTAFISTTFPTKFQKFALSKLHDPVKVVETADNLCPKNVAQYFFPLQKEEDRLTTCLSLLDKLQGKKVLVFCKASRANFKNLKTRLSAKGREVLFHHSEKKQSTREKVVSVFRKKSAIVLVNSGLLARGLDVADIDVVVMFDVSSGAEYVHSVGRCGRFGRQGVAVTLANQAQGRFLKNVEGKYKVKIQQLAADFHGI